MKKITGLLFGLLFLFSFSLTGQRIGDEKANVQFNRLPSEPLSKDFSTYSVDLFTAKSTLRNINMTEENILSKFDLNAFQKVDEGGHFRIGIIIENFERTGLETKKHETTTGEGDNKKTVTKYSYEMSYIMPVTVKLEDYEGNVHFEQTFNGGDAPMSYSFRKDKKSNFSSAREMREAWKKRWRGLYTSLAKKAVNDAIGKSNQAIKTKFDITPITKRQIRIKLAKGKKVAEADDFEKYYGDIKLAFMSMRPDESLDEIKGKVTDALDFWKRTKEKYPAGDKKTGKVHHACLYNLAVVNFWLDNLDEAEMYAAEAATRVDFKKKDAEAILKRIESAKAVMEANEIDTRHFAIETSGNPAPDGVAYPVLMEFDVLPDGIEGWVKTTDGETINGIFDIDETKSLDFRPGRSAAFWYMENEEPVKKYVNPELFSSFAFRGRNFVSMNFLPMSAGEITAKPRIMEKVFESDQINAYVFYPFNEPGDEVESEFAVQKKDDKCVSLSIANPRFIAWRKAFSKYLAECPALSQAIANGDYKRNHDMIMKAIEEYSQCN